MSLLYAVGIEDKDSAALVLRLAENIADAANIRAMIKAIIFFIKLPPVFLNTHNLLYHISAKNTSIKTF